MVALVSVCVFLIFGLALPVAYFLDQLQLLLHVCFPGGSGAGRFLLVSVLADGGVILDSEVLPVGLLEGFLFEILGSNHRDGYPVFRARGFSIVLTVSSLVQRNYNDL